MDHAAIYYFSATGNSLAVARDLTESLAVALIDLSSSRARETLAVSHHVVGLVFPTYDFKAPDLVNEFVGHIESIGSTYLFAVCTYGIAAGRSLKRLGKEIEAQGGRLSGGFAIRMPHNGIGCGAVREGANQRLFTQWKRRLPAIRDYVERQASGTIETTCTPLQLLRPETLRMMPAVARFAIRFLKAGADSLGFTASEDCNGCGVGAQVCPVSNIRMEAGRPAWSNQCINCFACLHWCPQHAITPGGLDAGIRPYHHPEITLSDLIARRN